MCRVVLRKARSAWERFWMLGSGPGVTGRVATSLAALRTPPYYGRVRLSMLNKRGYFSPSSRIQHCNFTSGRHLFLDDDVLVFGDEGDNSVSLGERVRICRGSILQTGEGGRIVIGDDTYIQPRCQLSAYLGSIIIGKDVQIAPNAAFYPYNHSVAPNLPIKEQSLLSNGDIIIEDDAWVGFGAIILQNVRIGRGAVVGAGAVVNRDVPDYAIVAGNPARMLRSRLDIPNA